MIVGPMAQLQRAQSLSIALLQISRAQKNMALATDNEELTRARTPRPTSSGRPLQDPYHRGGRQRDLAEAKAKWTALQQDWEGYAAIDTEDAHCDDGRSAPRA
jgi:methyl-accepting chemotaxis protein